MIVPLHAPVLDAPRSSWGRPAIAWSSGSLTYGDLRAGAMRVASALKKQGVVPGDRVGIWMPKYAEAVEAILGTLAAGAAYLPLDASAPSARIEEIVADAEPRVVLTTHAIVDKQQPEFSASERPSTVVLDEVGTGHGLDAWSSGAAEPLPDVGLDDLAVLLYTSGSTGRPKGVMLSHRNVGCFADWAVDRFRFDANDRFLSHAPLHFDLSTLDLFACWRSGGCVFLLDEKTKRFPAAVAKVVQQQRISVWYSVPMALQMLLEHGGIERRDFSSLRWILFAGEVFPVAALRRLMQALPQPRYANLYGPTETNVCTYHELSGPPADGQSKIPIGRPCEHVEVSIRDEDGSRLPDGEVGEICVAGPAVMRGYWNNSAATAAVRLAAGDDTYRTGDFACRQDGALHFRGRRDGQIKLRGHRIELAEIESCLLSHPKVCQTSVHLESATTLEARLVAFVGGLDDGVSSESLKEHCARRLPVYAVPSEFIVEDQLPQTATGKIDRQQLRMRLAAL